MKTLYVADLDGTLFNSAKKVSGFTSMVVARCIEKGMIFTIATARMPYGCDYRLTCLDLKIPGIVTNGVFLYDFSNSTFLDVETIPSVVLPEVMDAFRRSGCPPFVYSLLDGRISIFYEDVKMQSQTQYFSDRAIHCCREVSLVDDSLEKTRQTQVFYFAATGPENSLWPIKQRLDSISGVTNAYYLNIYNGEYCLEVFGASASKRNALDKLRTRINFDELVVFGDNLNDLSMIEVADRSYAPDNALTEVKNRVTEVIDSCDNDGVAKFLAKEWKITV